LGAEVIHSLPVGVEVVALYADALGASARVPGALFAQKKFCYFLTNLEADDPGSGKTIGCLLKERPIRNKSMKMCSGSLKRKSKKSDALRMVSLDEYPLLGLPSGFELLVVFVLECFLASCFNLLCWPEWV
jgi:hypothetical protein